MTALSLGQLEDNENLPMEPAEIANYIDNHMKDCRDAFHAKEDPMPFDGRVLDLEEYRKFCKDALRGVQPLPDKLLEDRKKFHIPAGTQLKKEFPPGSKCCIAVIPVTPRGVKFEKDKVTKGAYQIALIIKDEVTNKGFGMAPSHIFDILPVEIQKDVEDGGCTFDIPPYDYDDKLNVTVDDRDRIVALYEKAYENAQKIFADLDKAV